MPAWAAGRTKTSNGPWRTAHRPHGTDKFKRTQSTAAVGTCVCGLERARAKPGMASAYAARRNPCPAGNSLVLAAREVIRRHDVIFGETAAANPRTARRPTPDRRFPRPPSPARAPARRPARPKRCAGRGRAARRASRRRRGAPCPAGDFVLPRAGRLAPRFDVPPGGVGPDLEPAASRRRFQPHRHAVVVARAKSAFQNRP